MSPWLSEACISRSQPCLMFLGKKTPKKPFLTFVLLHSLAVSPPRFSLLIKYNNPKRGKTKRGKRFHTRSLCAGTATSWRRMQPVFDSALTDRLTDLPTDWLTGWLERLPLYAEEQQRSLLRPHRVSSLLRGASRPVLFPTWEPPRCLTLAATALTVSTLTDW